MGLCLNMASEIVNLLAGGLVWNGRSKGEISSRISGASHSYITPPMPLMSMRTVFPSLLKQRLKASSPYEFSPRSE